MSMADKATTWRRSEGSTAPPASAYGSGYSLHRTSGGGGGGTKHSSHHHHSSGQSGGHYHAQHHQQHQRGHHHTPQHRNAAAHHGAAHGSQQHAPHAAVSQAFDAGEARSLLDARWEGLQQQQGGACGEPELQPAGDSTAGAGMDAASPAGERVAEEVQGGQDMQQQQQQQQQQQLEQQQQQEEDLQKQRDGRQPKGPETRSSGGGSPGSGIGSGGGGGEVGGEGQEQQQGQPADGAAAPDRDGFLASLRALLDAGADNAAGA